MRRYQQGIFLGVVLSVLIAVAIALATSEERRRQLGELRKALPDGEQLKHSAQEMASKARETTSKLGQRTQEMVSAAQQTATSLGEKLQTKSADLVHGLRDQR